MEHQGWISLHRKIQDNILWKDGRVFSRAEAWIDILMEVQHDKKKSKTMIGNVIIECGRGQSIKSISTWADRWKWSRSAIQRYFVFLKRHTMITTENLTKTIRITVCNYDTYQNKRIDVESDLNRTRIEPESMLDTDNNVKNANNDKNEKKKKNEIIFLLEQKNFQNITPEDISGWERAYPAMDIRLAILQAAEWLVSNPTKLKSNYRRFLTNWFKREQERGGNKKGVPAGNKTKLFPIAGKICSTSNCRMPAVYKSDSGAYDTFYCSEHMPESVKVKYA